MKSKQPIRSKTDILHFFQKASVPQKELLIGIEVERSAVYEKDLSPVQYAGPSGYLAILKKLVREVGWKILNQDEKGNIMALRRGASEIHIEFDGRLELVSKPRKYLFNLCREHEMHAREIDEISKEFGIRWISMGWQPFAKNKEISFAFPETVAGYHRHFEKHDESWNKNSFDQWNKKANGIHVNFGYTSEKNAIEKFQTLLKISPILTAMFANSPLNAKEFSGFFINRPHSIYKHCHAKKKIQKLFLETDFSFEKWIDYLLNLPMRFIERKKKNIFVPLTFAEYLKKGFEKHRPRIDDFYMHIKSVWSEMRMKHYLEYRGFDLVPPHLVSCVPAIILGLTLNSDVMNRCQNLVADWSFEDHISLRERIYKDALHAETPNGGTVLEMAKKVLDIASASLKNYHITKKTRHDHSRLLWPIKEYIFVREQSPAEFVMEMWRGPWHRDPRKLLEWSES